MNLIYLYEGKFKHGEAGEDLIKEAAARYCAEAGIDFDPFQAEIMREEKGKPYFVDSPIDFSLTHSGPLWMCMFSPNPCGLDLQIEKKCDFEGIAKRSYNEEEQHYVDLWGQDGFFDVWVRKEAFAKMTGQGFFSEMPSTVTEKYDLADQVSWQGNDYYFQRVEIADNIKCVFCTGQKEPVEMRIIG